MGPRAPLHLTVFGSWMIGFGAAALFEYAPNASLWFPPAGITFGAVLVLGLRALPVLWLGCLIVTVLADQIYQRGIAWPELLLAGLGFAITHTLIYGAVALMVRRRVKHQSPGTSWANVILFLLGGAVASGLSSVLGGLSLVASGMADFASLPSLIVTWSIGDYAGLITVAPLFALLLTRLADALKAPPGDRLAEVVGLDPWRSLWPSAAGKLAGLTLLSAVTIAIAASFADQPGVVYALLVLLPLLLWIASTEPPPATLLGVFGITLLLAIAASLTSLANHALILQILVISLAVISYLCLAAARRAAEKPAAA